MKKNPHRAALVWYHIPRPFFDTQRGRVPARVIATPGLTSRPELTPAR